MLKKILLNSLIIFTLILSGCDEFYSFESKKLDKKAKELIDNSEKVSNTDEKIEMLINALNKVKKIQKRYPKTKIARLHRKENKINKLNSKIDQLRILSSKEKLEKKKSTNIESINKNVDLANIEFNRGKKIQSSLYLLKQLKPLIDRKSLTYSSP